MRCLCKRLQPDKLEPKVEKCNFIGYPKETIGYTFYHRSKGKIFVAKNGSFLEKEFLSKEVSGRKVELDEVIVPSLELESSTSEKSVPVMPTLTRVKLHIKFLLDLVGRTEHVVHQSGTVILSWKSCY